MRPIYLLLIAICCSLELFSQTIIPIESNAYSIVLQTDEEGRLRQVYFGEKLGSAEEYGLIADQLRYDGTNEDVFNHTYTPKGTWNIAEPALDILHADGNPATELIYASHEVREEEAGVKLTAIKLIDEVYKTKVVLLYRVFTKENVFEQWVEIQNNEEAPITLNKFASANLYFRNDAFHLTHYHGSWAEEMQPEITQLTHGIKVLDSKLGTRANLYAPPTFMLSFDQPATENEGAVMLANLAWSGNYQFDFEMDRYDNLRLIAGANSHASAYQLKPKEKFETPHFLFSYAENGIGEASRQMHDWARKYRLYDGEGERLTLLNNWEATYFDFNQEKLVELLDDAVTLGVDLFLLDDGWFANKYPRNSDRSGLGRVFEQATGVRDAEAVDVAVEVGLSEVAGDRPRNA
ncbi:MAG: glycoside hydrolase family 36 N-terminal domain-containing protein, partial [Bacteroidota bacterium]